MRRTYVHRPGHPKANHNGMVAVDDLGADDGPKEEGRNDTTILSGRFYENLQSPIDGSDIGSRQRYHDHMKQHGVAPTGDFKKHWAEAEQKRSNPQSTGRNIEALERAWYNLENRKRR